MDAVTFPEKKIIAFVQENFIPLQIAHDAKPLSSDFNIKWTPTLITLGYDDREHHRSIGFLNPEDFIARALLGLGKFHFDNDRYPEALAKFENLISSHPKNENVAEAIFLRGVSRYKHSGDRQFLKETYDILSSRYPDSEWTKRASPYKLL
jgi:tetratricopeptide (TPR) repeat protein